MTLQDIRVAAMPLITYLFIACHSILPAASPMESVTFYIPKDWCVRQISFLPPSEPPLITGPRVRTFFACLGEQRSSIWRGDP